MWSVGIIMFIMLSGYHPFDPHGIAEPKQVMADMKRGHFDFNDEAWHSVSSDAKDLIRSLIVTNPLHRYSAVQALEHPWLQVCACYV